MPADKNILAIKPASLSFAQSAAVPQAAVLALQGLRKGKIEQANRVLINGASGGMGSFAVPLAKSYGAQVTGVCRTEKMEFVHSLGADEVIDYTQDDFTKKGQYYDLILDAQGQHSIFDYIRALTPDGRYVMVGGASRLINQVLVVGTWLSLIGNRKMGLLLHRPDAGDLEILKGLIEDGTIKPVVDKSYPLSNVSEAFRYYGDGKTRGKLIITIDEKS